MRQFKQSHKVARKTWNLPESFPNHVVVNAYVHAVVEKSKDKCALQESSVSALLCATALPRILMAVPCPSYRASQAWLQLLGSAIGPPACLPELSARLCQSA